MNLSCEYYRVFYLVAKSGSISRAAKLMINNQPNLTRMIQLLEGELGCALFYRTNRGVKLTPEGERLYAHVRIAFEQLEAGERELAARRELQAGEVSIASSMVALRCVLLPVLKEYRRLYPNVRVHVGNSTTPQAIAAIREGEADLAVVTTPTAPLSAMEKRPLCTIRDVAVCGSAFPELKGRRVHLAELQRYPLISFAAETKTFETYSDYYLSQGLTYQPDIEAATADQVLPMVEANLGVGFVPEEFARGAVGITVLDLVEPLPARGICMLKRSGQPLSVAAGALERLLMERIGA